MQNLKRILHEPLVHFLVAGVILFVIFGQTHRGQTETASDKTITVDKQGLLNFLQYRSKAFETEYFTQELDAMSTEERQDLVDQYVQEEMLYREAKALGLEQGDYVIRQRMVQKMRYLIDDLTETGNAPDDAVLNAYLQKHKDIYTQEPSVTFTHVFVDSTQHSDPEARGIAEHLKADLNARGAAFNDAPQFGDRFPYFQNYVERTVDYVQSQFGAEFMAELAKLTPSDKKWVGPIRSMHGYHVVMLTSRTKARLPQLKEIRDQVAEDWERDRTEFARSKGLNKLASEYKIERKDLTAESAKR
jgi:hypothetical protein